MKKPPDNAGRPLAIYPGVAGAGVVVRQRRNGWVGNMWIVLAVPVAVIAAAAFFVRWLNAGDQDRDEESDEDRARWQSIK
jgi:hypothetical protein